MSERKRKRTSKSEEENVIASFPFECEFTHGKCDKCHHRTTHLFRTNINLGHAKLVISMCQRCLNRGFRNQ